MSDPVIAAPSVRGTAGKRITLLGLIAATYFMVAGGPYGLESVVQGVGYLWAVLLLLIIPFLWSLPTALMVSELSSTIPDEGGFYVWVRRGLGPFWGFQEAWLSLAASVFDMAIYPILFVTYLGYIGAYCWRPFTPDDLKGVPALVIGIAMIAVCAGANLLTPRNLGRSALLLTVALLAPFVVLIVWTVVSPSEPHGGWNQQPKTFDFVGALLFVLWNYMGWDNATTIAGEVNRPQRTYPLAMLGAVLLVTLTYLFPIVAASFSGVAPTAWKDGAWVPVAEKVGGRMLALAIGIGGMIGAVGQFNSLVLSYSRLPVVLAEDGYLPAFFTRRLRTGAPWVAVLILVVAWGLATQLGLKRALALDVILYGLSLLLEFAALVALRIREPGLIRPFRVPGGLFAALLLGVFPALLIGLAIVDQAGKWEKSKADEVSAEDTEGGQAEPPDKPSTTDEPEKKSAEEGEREEGKPQAKKSTKDDADDEMFAPGWGVVLGAGLVALGPLLYFASRLLARKPPPTANASG